MKYGIIAGSESVNVAIYRCFDFLSEADAKSYVKKFAKQPHDQDQVKHTLRELILGAFLACHGLTVKSDRKIDGKTPDWRIVENGDLKCLIEVVTFHTSKATKDNAIHAEIGGVGWTFMYQPDHTERLYETLHDKFVKYKDIVLQHATAYVAALFADFDAPINGEQLHTCLFDPATGLFAAYPHVSGVQVFMDTVLAYRFNYLANPHATRPFRLPDGDLTPNFFHQRPDGEPARDGA